MYVRRPDVDLVTANEQYSGIDVVLGCFPEGGDSYCKRLPIVSVSG